MAVHEGVENTIDLAEVVVAGELLFDVDEVFVDGIKTAGEEFADVEAEAGAPFEDEFGISDHVEAGGADGTDDGGMRDAEEGGDIPEDGSWFGRRGHGDIVFDDFDATLDEDVKEAGVFALGKDGFALGELLDGVLAECC